MARGDEIVPVNMQIAIDGPAGAGKSTVAQAVANRLAVPYIDTGAMYRSVTLSALQQGVSFHDEAALAAIASSLSLRFIPLDDGQRVFLDDRDATHDIRSAEVGALVSVVAAHPQVRERLVERQRLIVMENRGLVMDGRDIGTHVLPNADVKIYLTASLHMRASRRFDELAQRGYTGTIAEVAKVLRERDEADGGRKASPMRPADDAVIMDSTTLSIAEVVEMIIALCRYRSAQKGAE